MKMVLFILLFAFCSCGKKEEKQKTGETSTSPVAPSSESTDESGDEPLREEAKSIDKTRDVPTADPDAGAPEEESAEDEKALGIKQEITDTEDREREQEAEEPKRLKRSSRKTISPLHGTGTKSRGGVGQGSGTGIGTLGPPPATMAAPAPVPARKPSPRATGYHDMDQDEPVQQ